MEDDLKQLTELMDSLKDQKARLEFELKQTDKEIGRIELILQNYLKRLGVESMDYGVYSFGWKTTVSNRFSQKAFGEAYPDLLEKFKLPSESKKFEFKINK